MSEKEFLFFTAQEFNVEENSINLSTNFKNLSVWNSLNALIYIASINEKYNILISSNELASSNSLKELYELLKDK